jgi:hypothetical protein
LAHRWVPQSIRRHWIALALIAMVALVGSLTPRAVVTSSSLVPTKLSDEEFWRLASGFSEADGTFHSENLVSNETSFQSIIPSLIEVTPPGRAYVGVGSEQNYSYIAAVRPAMAFIVDIRRGNFDLHLAYKAIFELSSDRAEFVSRLFSRPRPASLDRSSSAREIFAAYSNVSPSETLHAANLDAIRGHLTGTRKLPLAPGDHDGIEYVYGAWVSNGPDIRYQLNGGGRGGGQFPSYADLMTATDDRGVNRSFLASEDSFQFIKDLHTRNLIVPVVGNFGGPKALRSLAGYLKQQNLMVAAFYTSNVEQYLRRDGLWTSFCESASTMPVDEKSVLIRSTRGGFGPFSRRVPGFGFYLESVPLAGETATCTN